MNKNSIIGFALIFLIVIGYSYFTKPTEEQIEKQRREMARRDSLQRVEEARKAQLAKERIANDTIAEAVAETPAADTNVTDSNMVFTGPFAAAKKGEDGDIVIETEKYKVKISKKGGVITYAEVKNYVTSDTLPLILFTKENASFNLILNDNGLGTKSLYFEPVYKSGVPEGTDSVSLSGEQKAVIAMRIYPNSDNGTVDKNRYLEFEYTFTGNEYMINFIMNMNRVNDIVAPGYNEIFANWNAYLTRKERDAEQERKHTTIYYKYKDDKVDYLGEMSQEDSEEINTKVRWISYKQQFFAATLIADDAFYRAKLHEIVDKNMAEQNPDYLETMNSEISIPLSGSDIESFKMRWYFGPTKFNILKKYDLDLDQQIPLGWGFFLLAWINKYAVIPVFDFLSGFGWNYGIIILVLTILIKLVLFPIAYKTYTSSAKMRVLKPEIDEIAKKYPKKEDAMKKQQATMALYKKVGVNPMAGCVPMLLQMPILIALFRFFPASIELRQQSFLWATDLSSYDSIFEWSTHIPIISTFYGNHISLFTLLMTITTIFYTRMNNQMMGSNNQMPGMKTVMYLMPIMFLGFFNNYAAGLSYYYFLANMITFGQMFIIRKLIDEDKIRKQLLANKKKPVKKSNLQKRLEEAAKKRGMK
jgi:YidC/Oxa1 family membrane protein insertase